ncbi:MAG: hypothetical protein NZ551_09245 [Microscillaceae bacterium]|nr:hypothetical protein [Microscillaceae bacterium]MDW8461385.1 hypothetical protein [Cytophagales bacterium]
MLSKSVVLGICLIFLFSSISILPAQIVFEQETTNIINKRPFYRFTLQNGNVCSGYVLEETNNEEILYTDLFGEIKVQKNSLTKELIAQPCVYLRFYNRHEMVGALVDFDKARVVLIEAINGRIIAKSQNKTEVRREVLEKVLIVSPDRIKNGKYWFPSETEYMYFLRQSAFPIKREQIMSKSQYSFLSLQYGVTDNLSVGIGTETISAFFLGWGVLGANLKYSLPLKKVKEMYENRAVLAMSISSLFIIGRRSDSGVAGLAEPIFTFGNPDYHFSLGAGIGVMTPGELITTLRFGGTARIGCKTLLLGEFGHVNPRSLSDNLTLGLLGFRFLGRKLHFDISLARIADSDNSVFGFPYFGFHIPVR